MSIPKVSVITIAYNQEGFIAQCINSVLKQRVSFPIEHIIADDCSSDQTRSIVEGLKEENPSFINLQWRAQNFGVAKNFVTAYNSAKGEYIAFCEGDDYWTDAAKLQLQVDFLDKNPDYALVHHRVSYLDNDSQEVIKEFPPEEYRVASVSSDHLARSNFIHICTLMIRRSVLPQLPDFMTKLKLCDWPLCALIAQFGHIGFIDRNMATYRMNNQGMWSTKSLEYRNQATLVMARSLLTELQPSHRKHWAKTTIHLSAAVVENAFRNRQFRTAVNESASLLRLCSQYQPRTIPYHLYRLAYLTLSACLNPQSFRNAN